MKFKILLSVCLIIIISSCKKEPYIGYIVCKEHILERMSNENATKYVESSFAPHHFILINHNTRHKINELYILYVANKDGVKAVNVTKEIFNHLKIKNKIKIFEDSIDKLAN